jgi:5-methyltetrahydrofolate--homocysteine methyltransferase
MMTLKDIYTHVVNGAVKEVEHGVELLLDQGESPESILNQALIPAMDEVGNRFERQEFYLPEMLIAARAMQSGLNVLKPLLTEGGIEPVGHVTIGTVKGDLHDIGKNLVGMMLKGGGFEVEDLGVDVPADKFVDAAANHTQIIGLSALLTTTMPTMKEVIRALADAGLREKVKVIIGGAPVTQDYANAIGADGYAPDAGKAVGLARRLISEISSKSTA